MRFKVPQDVQREDTILWFITLKQLIILMIGGGISFLIFNNYELSDLETILAFIPILIALAIAFIKIKGIKLIKFILLLIEQKFFRPPRRYWQINTNKFISITQPFKVSTKIKKETINNKKYSQEKIKNIAQILDT